MRGEISILVNPPDMGKGYGAMVFEHIVRYGYHTLNLRKIFLHSVEFNKKWFPWLKIKVSPWKELIERNYTMRETGMMYDEYEKNLVDLA